MTSKCTGKNVLILKLSRPARCIFVLKHKDLYHYWMLWMDTLMLILNNALYFTTKFINVPHLFSPPNSSTLSCIFFTKKFIYIEHHISKLIYRYAKNIPVLYEDAISKLSVILPSFCTPHF